MKHSEVNSNFRRVKLYFSHYYKYVFTFIGKAETGEEITTTVGGDSSDIYRFEVSRDEYEVFDEVDTWSGVEIKSGSDIIFSYYR